MPSQNYKVIVCEGRDQVGKADAILSFSQNMLKMNIPITYTSFPMYASPIGAIIRLFLRGGMEQLNISQDIDLKIKMSLYAINRLECLDFILTHKSYKKTLMLLDRGPYSNAITIAYGLVRMNRISDIDFTNKLIDYALNLDSLLRKTLNSDNCVVQMVTEGDTWNNVRNAKKDIYEIEEVQRVSDMVYELYAKRIGAGWRKIVTKKNNIWRSREEIFKDIFDFLKERKEDIKEDEGKLCNFRYEIGIEEILQNIYKGQVLPAGLVNEYLIALRTNDKDKMYDTACVIGVGIGKTCRTINFRNKKVRVAIAKIIDEIPEIRQIFDFYISKEFTDKFLKAINE